MDFSKHTKDVSVKLNEENWHPAFWFVLGSLE